MTSLLVVNPIRHRSITPNWTLTNVDPHSANDCPSKEALVKQVVFSGEHSTVYRASIGDQDVILKFCLEQRYQADLEREACAYQEDLVDLQGEVIPRFYGYYKGPAPDEFLEPISCIILEDCGKSLSSFTRVSVEDRVQILNLLGTMHKHGFHPDDFADHNVVGRNGVYRLIDFHFLTPHTCRWEKGFKWRSGKFVPNPDTFVCPILHHTACEDMFIWEMIRRRVNIAGYSYRSTKRFPCQAIIDSLIPEDYIRSKLNQPVLLKWIKGFKDVMDATLCVDVNKLIEEYKKTPPDFPRKKKIGSILKVKNRMVPT